MVFAVLVLQKARRGNMKLAVSLDDITLWNVGIAVVAIALAILVNQYLQRMVRLHSPLLPLKVVDLTKCCSTNKQNKKFAASKLSRSV